MKRASIADTCDSRIRFVTGRRVPDLRQRRSTTAAETCPSCRDASAVARRYYAAVGRSRRHTVALTLHVVTRLGRLYATARAPTVPASDAGAHTPRDAGDPDRDGRKA